MENLRPRFLSAYALYPSTGEVCEPPVVPDGFVALPYKVEGWRAGCKWVLVPKCMTPAEARRHFPSSPAERLVGYGWEEVFDPANSHWPAHWPGQQAKNLLMRMVGRPGRWVLTGDNRSFAEVIEALAAEGFAADHFHAVFGARRPVHIKFPSEGGVFVLPETKLSIFNRVVADEQHPR